jgi:Putative thioesterase (yiiD_Cterm)
MILQTDTFGREYLQDRIGREFTLAKHIGVVVESADDDAVVLRAPLGANANHQGTAFGGSLYALSVLTGWAWLTRFLIPVEGELRARGRITLHVQIAHAGMPATLFEGVFVAAMHR